MNQNKYYVLNIRNLKSEDMDAITEFVFDIGASGTEEVLSFVQNDRQYNPVTISKPEAQIKVYFENPASAEGLRLLSEQWPYLQLESESFENQDWLLEWKKGFKPFEIGQGFWVVPPWCVIPKDAKTHCWMEPGMAFGTGTHETTQIAAKFILESTNCAGSLLDVGTGTGLLAIVAEKVGFTRIVGNDVDPEALRVAKENCELNKVTQVEIVNEGVEDIQSQFDWVVANIIDGVLIQIQEHLKRLVVKGGVLILTGILKEREELFLNEFSFDGFRVLRRLEKGEWTGFHLEKLDS